MGKWTAGPELPREAHIELGDAKEETKGVDGTGFEENPIKQHQFPV